MPEHEIAPVFDRESKVLILGSFPSPKSREAGFYYAHPQNRMWRVLARIFAEPFPETTESRKEFLHRNHIAMWDVLKSCEIDGASDSSIRSAVPNDLTPVLAASDIGAVFTTGAKAASLYRQFQAESIKLPHIALPSTSPANAQASEDELAAACLCIRLFTLQDTGYREFIAGLVPTLPKEQFIGIRTPVMRKLCRSLAKDTALAAAFCKVLPHRYYEENGLHSFFIEQIRDYDACLKALAGFLPYVDNWATCDSMKPNIFAKNLNRLEKQIPEWIASGETYTVRFGIEMFMNFYLDERFDPSQPEKVAAVCPAGQDTDAKDYYIRMMVAWYFATALTKQWEAAIPYIENRRLSSWVHGKTIQKARESFRISDERKEYLKSLK